MVQQQKDERNVVIALLCILAVVLSVAVGVAGYTYYHEDFRHAAH